MPITRYEGDNGQIHPIRVSPQTFAVSGGPPAGATTSRIKAKMSKTNREHGLRPRHIIIAKNVGTEVDPVQKYARIPILTLDTFNSAPYSEGAPFTYNLTADWTIVSKESEDY